MRSWWNFSIRQFCIIWDDGSQLPRHNIKTETDTERDLRIETGWSGATHTHEFLKLRFGDLSKSSLMRRDHRKTLMSNVFSLCFAKETFSCFALKRKKNEFSHKKKTTLFFSIRRVMSRTTAWLKLRKNPNTHTHCAIKRELFTRKQKKKKQNLWTEFLKTAVLWIHLLHFKWDRCSLLLLLLSLPFLFLFRFYSCSFVSWKLDSLSVSFCFFFFSFAHVATVIFM